MSVRIMSLVWDFGPEKQSELLVLLALADFADDAGNCWPSMRRIAEKARVTERGAQKIVRRLEEKGHLKIAQGGGRHGCNQYTITPNVVHPEQGSPPNVETQKPRTAVQETPNGGSPEPSRTINKPSDKIRATLSSVLSEEVADDFIAHRKAKRAKLTQKAAELIAADLEECPPAEAEAAVLMSIKNGWTGVFPNKLPKGPTNGRDDERARAFLEGARGTPPLDRGPGFDSSQPLLPT